MQKQFGVYSFSLVDQHDKIDTRSRWSTTAHVNLDGTTVGVEPESIMFVKKWSASPLQIEKFHHRKAHEVD